VQLPSGRLDQPPFGLGRILRDDLDGDELPSTADPGDSEGNLARPGEGVQDDPILDGPVTDENLAVSGVLPGE
jgi:hypothetical protein